MANHTIEVSSTTGQGLLRFRIEAEDAPAVRLLGKWGVELFSPGGPGAASVS